jgi:hypothetical protein
VASFGRLDSSSSSSGILSYACSLVHTGLSWWGLKSSVHLHVAHEHHGSHYSVISPYQHSLRHVQALGHPLPITMHQLTQAKEGTATHCRHHAYITHQACITAWSEVSTVPVGYAALCRPARADCT